MYKKLLLTLKNDRHDTVLIVEIHNNVKNITVSFLKVPKGTDLGFYLGRYSANTTEDNIISDILKRLRIEKPIGYYFIREEYL